MRKNRNQSIQLLYGYNFIKVNEDYFIALLSKKIVFYLMTLFSCIFYDTNNIYEYIL